MIYDVVIIGGGVAGLYAAETFIEKNSTMKILVIEESNTLGKDAENLKLYNDDTLAMTWLTKYHASIITPDIKRKFWYQDQLIDAPSIVCLDEIPRPHSYQRSVFNFGEWLDMTMTDDFIFSSVCSYYLKNDIVDTLCNFRNNDNIAVVKWRSFFKGVVTYLKFKKVQIKKNTVIYSLSRKRNLWRCQIVSGSPIYAKHVIVTLSSKSTADLLKHSDTIDFSEKLDLLSQIKTRSITKVVIVFKDNINIIETILDSIDQLVCGPPFISISPIDRFQRTYVVNYNRDLMDITTEDQIKLIQETLIYKFVDIKIKIDKVFIYHHQMHTYEPLPQEYSSRNKFLGHLVHLNKNLTYIGETVALSHGSIESILQQL